MLSESVIERLKANWGDKANALACYAEVKLIDPDSSWEAYIIAINPNDEDECKAMIVNEGEVIITDTSLYDLLNKWNGNGEIVEQDPLFVRRRASALFKVLNERNPS